MRADIEKLLNRRPSWILHQDKTYQELLEAIEYAKKSDNTEALEELKIWLEQRRIMLLDK